MAYEPFKPIVRGSQVVSVPTWDDPISDEFAHFSAVNNVDIVRIISPHGCNEAILIAFLKEEPEAAKQEAIELYQNQMIYYCRCGKGEFGQKLS